MTLVAAARIRGVPVVFGDILISQRESNPGPSRPLPTRADAGDFLRAPYSIAGVRRKVVILSNHLAVAWAGSLLGAKQLIGELRGFVRNTPNLDRDHLFAFLDQDGYPDWGRGVRCELVGWLVDDRGPVAFHWKSDGDVYAGGEEYVVGTGADDFKGNARPDFFYTSPDLTPDEQVARIALGLASNAIGREMFSGETLHDLYGGAMEVALFGEGRFAPLTDIAFLFWHVETDPEGRDLRVTPMTTILKYRHIEDSLVVHTSRVRVNGGDRSAAQEMHVVTHVDQDDIAFDVPTFLPGQSKYYCNCIGGRVVGYGRIIGQLILGDPNPLIAFGQGFRDGKLDEEWLEMNTDFLTVLYDIIGHARNPLPNSTPP
jgi:hypothetical protein